jgi:hypothetical protein
VAYRGIQAVRQVSFNVPHRGLVAMIGAIILTMKSEKRYIRKQQISSQVYRTRSQSLAIVKVKSGEGIDL